MDIQKERELCEVEFEQGWDSFCEAYGNGYNKSVAKYFFFESWQAAKAQAIPENKPFNLDEFLTMEEKLKSKGGVIAADLDQFIDYAEMVLEKAKALKEPK